MQKKKSRMQETLGVRVSSKYLKAIDLLIENGVYSSKGEIVREGLRRIFLDNGIRLLENDQIESKKVKYTAGSKDRRFSKTHGLDP